MGFLRQVQTLVNKNLLVTLVRAYASTPFRAFILPVIYIAFLYELPYLLETRASKSVCKR